MAANIKINPHGVEPIDENTVNEDQNVYQEFDVDVKNDKIDNVLRLVCASLNSKIRSRHELKLQFNIVPSAQRITSHEFDDFYKKIEDKLVENFCKNTSDFIDMKRECDTNQMRLIVKKSPKLYSIRNYLYIPTASSIYESPFEKAVDILRQNGDPEKLPKPPEEGSYKICEIVKNLRQENVDVQFKTINTEKNIAKNMADHCRYISAFANKDGGCLYFGIEDNDGRVVGVNTEKKNEIDAILTDKIRDKMILASDHTQKLKRGIHWDIKYFKIEADDNLGELYVAKFNSTRLSCKSDEILELISGDTKTWWTFKKVKKQQDEEEEIGFVHMSSVTKCFRFIADNDIESVKRGEQIMSYSDEADRNRRISCRKINGQMIDLPFQMLIKIDGEWYNYNFKTPAEKKEKFDMSFGKGDVVELVSVDPNDVSCMKMKKIINNKEFSMPISHLKKLHIGKGHSNVQQMDTEERNVIVITVARIPGGVLTACPLSYFADEKGIVRTYTFPQWKNDMLKTRPEPCNIEIWDLKQNLVDTRNDCILKEYMTENQCVTLKGLMGTGKTSLALKYCYNFKETKPTSVVWKFKCSNIELLQESMNELWHHLIICGNNGSNYFKPTDMDTLQNEILKQFQYREKMPYLHVLLFDDVKDSSRKHVKNFSEKCLQLRNIKIILTALSPVNDDSNILEIKGLSSDEAASIFQGNVINDDCKTLAEMLWYNPFAICIAKTYMTRSHLKPNKMINILKGQGSWYKMEESIQTKDYFKDPPLTSLVRMIATLEESYQKEEKTHIFEMLLMLQFLEVEDIPIILFGTMFDTVEVDEFVHEVDNISFGIIKGFDDDRLLTVHEMAVMALNKFTQDNSSNGNLKLLKKMLRSFFLSMDKDNNNEQDLCRHKALLPHARKIIDCVDNLSESDEIAVRGTEFQMHLAFVSDVIIHMMSTQLNMYKNRERALKHVFSILNIVDPFVIKDTIDRAEDNTRIQEVANNIVKSIENFLSKTSNSAAVKKTGMDYLLNKYRNIEDRYYVSKVLSKQYLERESQLSEAEYKVLCQKGFAVPQKDIGPLFLYELVILTLHSYGKMSLRSDNPSPNFENYLQVAYILSNTITHGHIDLFENDQIYMRPNRFQYFIDFFLYFWTRISYLWTRNTEVRNFNLNSISIILTERSLLKLKRTDEEAASTIIKYIDVCKKRLNETTQYLEFGVFKVDTESCQLSKLKWMEHIISFCDKLVKVDTYSNRNRVKKECESLKALIESMPDHRYKFTVQDSLGKLYFEMNDFEQAEYLRKICS